MCTSIVSNRKKTIVGWNFDLLDMEYKVVAEDDKVYIAVNDKTEGWLPLFGANSRGDFTAMPTCWPFDDRSDPVSPDGKTLMRRWLRIREHNQFFIVTEGINIRQKYSGKRYWMAE